MTNYPKNHSALWIEGILILGMLITPLITLCIPWLKADFAIEAFQSVLEQSPGAQPLAFYLPEVTLLTKLLLMSFELFTDAIFIMVLWQLKQLCSGYRRQELFTLEQICRYKKLGLWVCMIFVSDFLRTPLLSIIMSMSAPEHLITFRLETTDLRELLVGVAVLALYRVMLEAKRMADDQALTV